MKTRKGFVSNSSSSSFIIAHRHGLEKSKLADILREKSDIRYNAETIFLNILKKNSKVDFDICDLVAEILLNAETKENIYDYEEHYEELIEFKNRGLIIKEDESDDKSIDLTSIIDRFSLFIELRDEENDVYIFLEHHH